MASKIVEEVDQISSHKAISLGLLFILLFSIMFYLFSKTYESSNVNFYGTFKSVDGIDQETPVTISGIKVGSISNIILNEDYSVLIEGVIDKKIKIPSDSILRIDTNGIFGKKYLIIIPGYEDFFDGNEFTFSYTSDSYTLDYLARKLESM